ncbi:hypothetical protein DSM3645_10317 [Blastopirellula marina DSM 3645]|uniref:Uncharacterized protein n=1 Tax=Blastopirellula marina DSM 3645 TaxID=314230 RepID=A3ZM04_9BACT|nr:hypothetical protein DSM3645_10317 [Blastopirellula marina DSM 3645]
MKYRDGEAVIQVVQSNDGDDQGLGDLMRQTNRDEFE